MNARDSRKARLLVVSGYFPPHVSGSTILTCNVLASYPGEVCAAVWENPPDKADPAFQPPCPVQRMRLPRGYILTRVYDRIRHKALGLWLFRRFLQRQVDKCRPTVILGTMPTVSMFIAAFQVAQRAGIPFYAHMHDLWEENAPTGSDSHRLARQWERTILTKARRVLCITESQADFYREKHGVTPQLLPHTVTPQALDAAPKGILRPSLPERTVLFVGAVSRAMNEDSLRVLAKASELLPADVRLLFLSNTTLERLGRQGIASSRLAVRSVPRQEVQRLLSACHVSVVPLSHKNGSANEVRTVFSTKLLEYMVSGRPILVFAPDSSFHARSACEHGWGLVVSQDDPQALADGILRLLSDDTLAEQLVVGALAEARRRDARTCARQLYEWVLQDSSGGAIPEGSGHE
jgi:glycosyltransferase involved in cell wall biosynthesis